MTQPGEDRTALLAAARNVSVETGVAAAVLLAVAITETAAQPFARFEGRREPLIRFEGHHFDRLLSPADRSVARAAGLADPKAGAGKNPAAQAARWRLLDRAAAIDAAAAYAATSWGLGQVMGAHWRTLGYRDARALAAEARGSVEGQFRLMARFLVIGDLHRRLEEGDLVGFARRYNGPAFRRNGYDAKIGRAYAQGMRWLAEGEPRNATSPSAPVAPPARVAEEGTPTPGSKPAKGWSKRGGGLVALASWILHRFSTRAATRSFSTSTERSSAFATTRPPSVSNRTS